MGNTLNTALVLRAFCETFPCCRRLGLVVSAQETPLRMELPLDGAPRDNITAAVVEINLEKLRVRRLRDPASMKRNERRDQQSVIIIH